jgi:hypothetical protein
MSKKTQTYTQCVIHKKIDDGVLVHTAWIPSEFAKVARGWRSRSKRNGPRDGW